MLNPLSERAQRWIIVGLILLLLVFGVYFALGGFEGGTTTDEPQGQDTAQETPGGGGAPGDPEEFSTVPPSPLPTAEDEDLDVFDWFPFTQEELTAAGATARAFAEAYGTIDYTQDPESYYSGMEELATDDYASVLSDTTRAGAFWDEMSEVEAVAEGRAVVDQVRTFGDDSITFVVTAQSITQTEDAGFDEDLGEFAITVVRDGDSWLVHDFQPADAGQFGEERNTS